MIFKWYKFLTLILFPVLVLGAETGGDEFKSLINEPNLPEDAPVLVITFGLILLFTWFWEIINDVTEWACLVKDQKHILAMREKLFKELTLLGVISLILFMVAHSSQLSRHNELVFEFVHLALFALFGVYSLLNLGIIFLSVRISIRWEKLERVGPPETFSKMENLKERINRTWITFLNPIFRYQLWNTQWDEDYHKIRLHFIEQHKLPNHFKFHRYLLKCMKEVFGEIAQLHWSVGVVILFGNILIWFLLLSFSIDPAAPLWITAVFLITGTGIIYWKISKILKTLRDDEKFLNLLNQKQDRRDNTLLESRIEKDVQNQSRIQKSNFDLLKSQEMANNPKKVHFSKQQEVRSFNDDELSEVQETDSEIEEQSTTARSPLPSVHDIISGGEAVDPDKKEKEKKKKEQKGKGKEKKKEKEKEKRKRKKKREKALKEKNTELKKKNMEMEKKFSLMKQELESIKHVATPLKEPRISLTKNYSAESLNELASPKPPLRTSVDLRTGLRKSGLTNILQQSHDIFVNPYLEDESDDTSIEVSSWESQSESSWTEENTWTGSENEKDLNPTTQKPSEKSDDKKEKENKEKKEEHDKHHRHHRHFRKKHKSQYHHEHLESPELAWITKAVVPLWYGHKSLKAVLPYFFWCIAPRKSAISEDNEEKQLPEIEIHNTEKKEAKKSIELFSLFWFNRPFFLVYTIQIIMFMQAIFLGISLALVFNIFEDKTNLVAEILAIILSFILLVGITPSIIERYAIISNVAELSTEEYLEEIKERYHKSEFYKSYLTGNLCYDEDCSHSYSHSHLEGGQKLNLRQSMAKLHKDESKTFNSPVSSRKTSKDINRNTSKENPSLP